MANPVIEYTNLLHAKKSLNDPAVLTFKQNHQDDPNFLQQAEVVEWAFRARNTAKEARKVVATHGGAVAAGAR
jgi:hypothetical protein